MLEAENGVMYHQSSVTIPISIHSKNKKTRIQLRKFTTVKMKKSIILIFNNSSLSHQSSYVLIKVITGVVHTHWNTSPVLVTVKYEFHNKCIPTLLEKSNEKLIPYLILNAFYPLMMSQNNYFNHFSLYLQHGNWYVFSF